MKKTKIIALLALSVLAVTAAYAKEKKSKQKKPQTVRIVTANSLSQRESNTAAVAKELGLFEEELAKVGFVPEYFITKGGIILNEGIYADEFDIGFIGDVPGFTGLYNEIGSVWIANSKTNADGAIATRKDLILTKPEDLYGKTVALFIGTAPHVTWGQYVKGNHLDESKINVVNMNGADTLAALSNGKVDAAVSTATGILSAVNRGDANLFFNSASRPEWGGQYPVIARKKFAQKNPEATAAIIKALFRAQVEIAKNPERWYDAISGYMLNGNTELGATLSNIDGGKFYNFLPEITDELYGKAQALVDLFVDLGRFKARKDVHTFADTSYYKLAVRELKKDGFAFAK